MKKPRISGTMALAGCPFWLITLNRHLQEKFQSQMTLALNKYTLEKGKSDPGQAKSGKNYVCKH